METEATVKKTQSVTVAFIAVKGSLSLINTAFGTLYTFVAESGFIPAVPPSRVYFNVPGQVPDKELKWELRVPIVGICDASGPDGKGLGFRLLETTTVAAIVHRGPFSTIGETYDKLKSWIAEKGYKIAGPCEEVYLTEPGNTPPVELMTEIRLPVSKK
ncbi:MAG: GyrI-like domain-containing protein [Dehalococcoidia bacterium]|jgi:effector-binding domain-containing protein